MDALDSPVGDVFVPLDVRFAAERIRFILDDSAASLIVTLSFYTPSFAGTDLPLLVLDALEEDYARFPARRLARRSSDPEDDALAYTRRMTASKISNC